MQDHKAYFKGKKITVLGLGVLGRGVGDTAFLSECGAELIVTDLKSEAELKASLDELKGYQHITYVLGKHRHEDFKDRDMILKSAGVPLDSPYIETAEANNIPVEMSASLVTRLTSATVIGITGSRGKSTVTQLIAHILKAAGKSVYLAGNVRGIATLPVLEEAREGDYIVMELDSWQLQGFGAAGISPHIAVFTSFLPDHMNYYKNDMQRYFDDKANIFKFQKKGDVLITTKQSHNAIDRYSNVVPGNERVVEPVPTDNPALLGEHNKHNVACAVAAAKELGIKDKAIREAIASFSGVEGRLQCVREMKGIKIYNDNNATSPDATIAALHALGKNIVLIMGGADKALSMEKLIAAIPEHCKKVILLPGTGTDRIKEEIEGKAAASLQEAVTLALKEAKEGDTILFSPAFASFGLFKNEYDRNDQFLELIESLS